MIHTSCGAFPVSSPFFFFGVAIPPSPRYGPHGSWSSTGNPAPVDNLWITPQTPVRNAVSTRSPDLQTSSFGSPPAPPGETAASNTDFLFAMDSIQANLLWEKACAFLREVFSRETYDTWISVIRAVGDDDGDAHLTLSVPNGFYQDWLQVHYLPMMKKALAASGNGETPSIRFLVDASSSPRDPEPDSTPVPSPQPAPHSARHPKFKPQNVGEPLDPRHTFDAFVVGKSNNFAAAAAHAVVDNPGRIYNPLFIHGGTGLGKTHLIQAIAQATLAREGKARVCYTTCESFTNEFISALKSGEIASFRKKYRNIDLLLIDDIHFLAGKNSTQEEFFHTFNALYQNQKQIVLTSDRPLAEIPQLEKRLVSRFEWGLTAEMEMVDLETRVAILRNKCEHLQLSVSDEALFFIAEHIHSNIRKLEGAFLRVTAYASLTRKPLTREMLEYLLRETIEQERQTALTIETVQRVVAEHYDIRLADMTSKQRTQNIAFPRQIAMYLSRQMIGQSFPAIGKAFDRDHATAIHAYRTITAKMRSDTDLRQTILSLQQRLGGAAAPR